MKHTNADAAFGKPAWSVFPELEPVPHAEPTQDRRRARAIDSIQRKAMALEGHIRATTISVSNFSQYGDLFVSLLKARKETFIDGLHWDLPQVDGMEFDQYDTPEARWIAIHEFGEVLGGIRLTPTTARCGVYSYMLRDAQKGLLTSIPSDVLFFEAPVDRKTWEASRLFICDRVPAQRRMAVQNALMGQMIRTACEQGASHVIGIVPAVWSRWLRRLGLNAVAVGPKFVDDGIISQAALFNVLRFYN